MEPSTMRPGGCGMSRMIESAVTLLPQPDSPTTPSVSPLSMWKSTPSTARTTPSSVKKWVLSPRTSSSRSAIAGSPALRDLFEGVERAADVVGVDVLVGDASNERGRHRVQLDLPRPAPGHQLVGAAGTVDPQDHDVGLHAPQIDAD